MFAFSLQQPPLFQSRNLFTGKWFYMLIYIHLYIEFRYIYEMLSSTAASLSMYPKRMTKRTLTTEAKSWSSAQQQHDIASLNIHHKFPHWDQRERTEKQNTVFSQYSTSTHQHRFWLFVVRSLLLNRKQKGQPQHRLYNIKQHIK